MSIGICLSETTTCMIAVVEGSFEEPHSAFPNIFRMLRIALFNRISTGSPHPNSSTRVATKDLAEAPRH